MKVARGEWDWRHNLLKCRRCDTRVRQYFVFNANFSYFFFVFFFPFFTKSLNVRWKSMVTSHQTFLAEWRLSARSCRKQITYRILNQSGSVFLRDGGFWPVFLLKVALSRTFFSYLLISAKKPLSECYRPRCQVRTSLSLIKRLYVLKLLSNNESQLTKM